VVQLPGFHNGVFPHSVTVHFALYISHSTVKSHDLSVERSQFENITKILGPRLGNSTLLMITLCFLDTCALCNPFRLYRTAVTLDQACEAIHC